MGHDSIVWLNGELLRQPGARIDPLDRGFLLGEGVFETLRAYAGEPFAARSHLERLAYAATVFQLPVPGSTVLEAAMRAVLDANGLMREGVDARIRVTLTGGAAAIGSGSRAVSSAEPTVLVTAEALAVAGKTASVLVVPFTRNPCSATAGIKTTSYAENSLALRYARDRRYDEAILADTRGDLCEGATSNVFVLLGGRLLTPPLDTGCLPGVTRGLVLKAAGVAGIDVREKRVPVSALERSEGAFLTSSLRELQPVAAVGAVELPPCGELCSSLAIR